MSSNHRPSTVLKLPKSHLHVFGKAEEAAHHCGAHADVGPPVFHPVHAARIQAGAGASDHPQSGPAHAARGSQTARPSMGYSESGWMPIRRRIVGRMSTERICASGVAPGLRPGQLNAIGIRWMAR
jgi:hypothetical protein